MGSVFWEKMGEIGGDNYGKNTIILNAGNFWIESGRKCFEGFVLVLDSDENGVLFHDEGTFS